MTGNEVPSSMRALEVTEYSGPSAVRLGERPVPEPRPGQVLIRVRAAGINFADVMQARGLYVGGPKAPYIAGVEASGEIVRLGDPNSTEPLGGKTRVMGFGPAAFAEYVVWPQRSLMPLPDGWSFAQGAAFPVQWLTAHGCLKICGRIRAGETVLIHAAAGGVGTAAIRLAKHYGATVIATASSAAKLDFARQHGADHLINYVELDFVAEVKRLTNGRGVDLILEMVGGETFTKNVEAVVPFGRIVVFGAASATRASVSNVDLVFRPVEFIGYHLLVMATRRPDLFAAQCAEIADLVAAGVARPDEPRVIPLADAARALRELESRQTTGKLVLVP
jgi:NADPH2:quinone reductase